MIRRPTRSVLASLAGGLALAACIPDEPPPPKAAAPAAAGAEGKPADKLGDLDTKDAKGLLAAVESMKAQLKGRPRDFSINVALGNLFYDNGRYVDALEYYRDAMKLAEEPEKTVLSLRGKPAAKEAPAECRANEPDAPEVAKGQKTRSLESIVAGAKAQTPADGPAAVACWRELVPSLAALHSRQGNAWYLAGNGDKARDEHEAALQLDPDQPEALFFKGAHILEGAHGDKEKLAAGRAEWEHLLKVAPNHPRANIVRETLPRIEELFGAHPKPAMDAPMAGHPPVAGSGDAQGPGPLPAGVQEAMANVQMTPELAKQLDQKLVDGDKLLEEGKWQEALDTFKGVMPVRPDGHVALGMGIALRELGKPMAERVLQQAGRMPGGDPSRATFELAVLYEKTNPEQAKALFGQLSEDAKWGAQAKARLAKLP